MGIATPRFPRTPRSGDPRDILQWAEAVSKELASFSSKLRDAINIPVTATVPAETPEFPPMIKLYDSGAGVYRLYVYVNGAWRYLKIDDGGTPTAHKDTHKSGGSDAFASTDLLEAIVKRLKESGGQALLLGSIGDGEALARSGTGIVGVPRTFFHAQDQQASGTTGGTFTSGAWRTRTLNTVLTNTISGASLNANQITLPVGTYDIAVSAPGYRVDEHKAQLYNISDSATVLNGTSEFSASGSSYAQSRSLVSGRFTIAAQKVFEVQHMCTTTRNPNGFGVACTFGVNEVFTDVKIWKFA